MGSTRQDFYLHDEDIEFLDSLGMKWEAIEEGNIRAVILYDFILPKVFQPEIVNLQIKITDNYSSGAALDMFFTNVHVTRSDGKVIPNFTGATMFNGSNWWQWSRHYPSHRPWRAGIDSLVSHILYIQTILDAEAEGKR